jgi:hypothetical protein
MCKKIKQEEKKEEMQRKEKRRYEKQRKYDSAATDLYLQKINTKSQQVHKFT